MSRPTCTYLTPADEPAQDHGLSPKTVDAAGLLACLSEATLEQLRDERARRQRQADFLAAEVRRDLGAPTWPDRLIALAAWMAGRVSDEDVYDVRVEGDRPTVHVRWAVLPEIAQEAPISEDLADTGWLHVSATVDGVEVTASISPSDVSWWRELRAGDPEPACPGCGGTDLNTHDGVRYCTDCDTDVPEHFEPSPTGFGTWTEDESQPRCPVCNVQAKWSASDNSVRPMRVAVRCQDGRQVSRRFPGIGPECPWRGAPGVMDENGRIRLTGDYGRYDEEDR